MGAAMGARRRTERRELVEADAWMVAAEGWEEPNTLVQTRLLGRAILPDTNCIVLHCLLGYGL